MDEDLQALLGSAEVAGVDKPRGWTIPAHAASPSRRQVDGVGSAPLAAPRSRLPDLLRVIPDELLVSVLVQLDGRTLGRLACTCRRFRRQCSAGVLWCRLFRRRFPRAFRVQAGGLRPQQLARLPWKRSYHDQLYEQWARRRLAQEQRQAAADARQQQQFETWSKIGGRGTQRMYRQFYEAEPVASPALGSRLERSSLGGGSPVGRQPSGSSVMEQSLGLSGKFFMEQMAANTRQFLKPTSTKRPFLRARSGASGGQRGGRGAAPGGRGRGGGRAGGRGRGRAGAGAGAGAGGGRQRRPVSATGGPRGPRGPVLVPPPTA